jgi:hypothetical protein
MSLGLFCVYINDIVGHFRKMLGTMLVLLGMYALSLLLFADDLVFVAKSPCKLQMLINILSDYVEEKKIT